MNAFHLFFHWPDGGVWANLVASFIWGLPAYLKIRTHQKNHKKSLEHLHTKVDKILDK